MSNWIKRIIYLILTAIVILSSISLVVFKTTEEQAPSYVLSAEELNGYVVMPELLSGKMGCPYCTNAVVCASCMEENIRPFFRIDVSNFEFNTFVLTFKEKIPGGIYFKFYFDQNGHLDKGQYKFGNSIEGNSTLTFSAPLPDDTTVLYLDAYGSYTVTGVTFYNTNEKTVSLVFNPVALIVLLSTLALAACLEWKLGYYRWIVALIKKEIAYVKTLFKERSRWCFWLHVANLTVTAVFLVLLALFLLFNHYYGAAIIALFCICAAAVMLQLADRILLGKGKEVATLFLVLTLLMGITVCAITPPRTNTAWDDSIHLRQSYSMVLGSHGFSLATYKYFTDSYGFGTFMTDTYQFTRRIVAEDAIALDFTTPTDNPVNLFGHVPTAAAILLCRALQFDLIKMVAISRMATLLTYAAIIYFAIKKLKRGGLIFASICLLSCPLFLACSFKADYWMIAWMAYGFATIFSVYQDEEMRFTKGTLCKILVAFFLACAPKMIYCVILLPLLFLDKNKFEKPTHRKYFRLATIGAVALLLALIIVPGLFNNFYTDGRGGANVNSVAQMLYILQHPFSYLTLLLRFLINLFSIHEFHNWNTGFAYGFLPTTGAWHATVALFLMVFALLVDRDNKEELPPLSRQERHFKWITIGSCLLTLIVIATSMYVGFNGVGNTEITGVQFRYLFPLFLPFFYYIAPRKLRVTVNETVRDAVLFGGLALNFLIGFTESYIQYFFYY